MVKIGIIGSRSRDTEDDYQAVRHNFMDLYEDFKGKENVVIVSGGCKKGGDRFAEMIAKELDLYLKVFPPNWGRYVKAAGVIRNKLIAEESDWLIACPSYDRSGGTEYTIAFFKELHRIYDETPLIFYPCRLRLVEDNLLL